MRTAAGPWARTTRGLAVALMLGTGTMTPASATAADESNQIVTRSPVGAWILRSDAAQPGLNCAVHFQPARGGAQLAIFGPTPRTRNATILFSGPELPGSAQEEDVQATLHLRGLAPTPLKARQLPRQAGQPVGMMAVPVGDVGPLLRSMRDQERGMELHLRQGAVFHMDYDGFDQARAALQDCLAGRRHAGKSLDEGLAELRPVGTSTITGNVFYKAALLARKQFPPKGSRAVSLIWMTDEFKRWHEQVKQDGKMPEPIPERIAKHFMRTTITDDEGGFTFTRLPAGEYMLIADFSYGEQVTRSELVGQTHVFRGHQHLGTQDHRAYWTETVRKSTTFEKTVVIRNDGDRLTVSLDKSQLICFFVCF